MSTPRKCIFPVFCKAQTPMAERAVRYSQVPCDLGLGFSAGLPQMHCFQLKFLRVCWFHFLHSLDPLWERFSSHFTPSMFQGQDQSLVVSVVMNQLCLARSLGQAGYRPWEGRRQAVTPRQVRRIMPAILSQLGTPARRCQRRGKSPGRTVGFHPKPAPRYDVVIKRPKKPSKPSG